MEDISAKRDARRKRILENAERRLLKIIGQKNNIESEGKHVFVTTVLFMNVPIGFVQLIVITLNITGDLLIL